MHAPQTDAAREPILVTTNTDPYEIYHINPDGTLTTRRIIHEMHCQFVPIADWDKAPCEYSDEELEEFWQNEDMGFDPYLGCYTNDC